MSEDIISKIEKIYYLNSFENNNQSKFKILSSSLKSIILLISKLLLEIINLRSLIAYLGDFIFYLELRRSVLRNIVDD